MQHILLKFQLNPSNDGSLDCFQMRLASAVVVHPSQCRHMYGAEHCGLYMKPQQRSW